MKLLQALLSRRPAASPVVVAASAAAAADGNADEACPGCGWFDSSHDLRAGLQVREHAANDAVCAELPLDMWFELQQA